jgi:hypothetical protein
MCGGEARDCRLRRGFVRGSIGLSGRGFVRGYIRLNANVYELRMVQSDFYSYQAPCFVQWPMAVTNLEETDAARPISARLSRPIHLYYPHLRHDTINSRRPTLLPTTHPKKKAK